MSAFLKATTVLSGLALTAGATLYTLQTPAQDFSRQALVSAEHVGAGLTSPIAKKLPSNFYQFTLGEHKISNHRA